MTAEAARAQLTQERLRSAHLREELRSLQQSIAGEASVNAQARVLPIARYPCEAGGKHYVEPEYEVSSRCLDACVQLAAQALEFKGLAATTAPGDEALTELESRIWQFVLSRSDDLRLVAALTPSTCPADGQQLSAMEASTISKEKEVLCELVDVLLEGRDVSKNGDLSAQAAALLESRRSALMRTAHRSPADLRDKGTAEAVASALEQLVSEERSMHAELEANAKELTAELVHVKDAVSLGFDASSQCDFKCCASNGHSRELSAEVSHEQHKATMLCSELKSAEDRTAYEQAAAAAAIRKNQQGLESCFAEIPEKLRNNSHFQGVARSGAQASSESASVAPQRALGAALRQAAQSRHDAAADAAACVELRQRLSQLSGTPSRLPSFGAASDLSSRSAPHTDAPSAAISHPVAVEEALESAERSHREALSKCLQASVRLAMERGRARAADTLLSKVRTELVFAESRLASR